MIKKDKNNTKVWDNEFYKKGSRFLEDIFRIPHPDIPKFVKLLNGIMAKYILDLGCGTGRHIIALAKKDFSLHGIDVSEKALGVAKEKLEKENLDAKLKRGDIYKKLPYKDNFFDGIISTKAMHHGTASQIKELIKEMERIMNPGGILMIEVPKRKRKYGRKDFRRIEPGTYASLTGPEANVPHHIFTKRELRNFFKNFEMLDIHHTRKNKQQTFSSHYTMFAKLKGKIKNYSRKR